jgi:intracellular sulfur oxidation DsrE/DsrF family protein
MKVVTILVCLLVSFQSYAQQKVYPFIKGFGGVSEIPLATEKPDSKKNYKIIVEVNTENPQPAKVHELMEKIAAIANLHVLGGVQPEKLQIVAVIHGPAAMYIMNDSVYQQKYGSNNPNIPLFHALREAGIQVFVCGQSMMKRNIDPATISPDLGIALSAMTTLSTYQQRGYVMLKL